MATRVTLTQRQYGVEAAIETEVDLAKYESGSLDKVCDVMLDLVESMAGVPGYASKRTIPEQENQRRRGAAIARSRAAKERQ